MKKNLILLGSLPIALLAGSFVMNSNSSNEGVYESRSGSSLVSANGPAGMLELNHLLKGDYTQEEYLRVAEEARMMPENRSVISWHEHGPDNIGGRTRAILIDNQDYTHIYAGSVTGGLFESVDRANFWTPVNEFSESHAISSMCQTPDGVLYVATGHTSDDSDGGQGGSQGANGSGMYVRNSDGSFSVVDGTEGFSYINEVVADTLHNIVWIASSDGIKKYDPVAGTITEPTAGIGTGEQGFCRALSISPDGEIIIAALGSNKTHISLDGGVNFIDVTDNSNTANPIIGSASRMEYGMSHEKADNGNYYIYASAAGNFLTGIYMSQNNGLDWTQIAPQNNQQPGSFSPFSSGSSGQGTYNNIITAVKGNPKKLILGGIDTYSWATTGNWTQLSQWFLPPQSSQYVHADNHEMKWDKHGRLYIGNDGGIQVSDNGGQTFFPANRGYNVTQFYAIGASAHGDVIGGTQDNGSLANYHDNTTWHEFEEVGGGDGFSSEISFINRNILLTSIYYGGISRSADRGENSTLFVPDEFSTTAVDNIGCTAGATEGGCGGFVTNFKMWENPNDLNSTDSVQFIPSEAYQIGDTILVPSFTSQVNINHIATFANTYQDTLNFNSGLTADDSILTSTFGTDYNLTVFDYTIITGAHPLAIGDSVYIVGVDTIVVDSTSEIDHYYGTNPNEPGEVVDMGNEPQIYGVSWDTLLVQDTYQSWFAVGLGSGNGIWMTRNALRFSASASEWFKVADTPAGGLLNQISVMEFSQDGNHLFIGTWGGKLYRLSDFGDVYSPAKVDEPLTGAVKDTLIDLNGGGTVQTSFTDLGSMGAPVTGIAVEADPTHVVITLGLYSGSNKVRESTDALGSSNSSFTPASGNLPSGLPCFSVVMPEPNTWVIGTDRGIYITEDGGSTWENCSGGIGNTPVYDMKINWRTWNEGNWRPGEIYAGTHGRGIWSSADFLSMPSEQDNLTTAKFIPNINVYPNPMSDQGNIGFSLESASNVSVQIFNLNGQLVREINEGNMAAGNNNIQFSANDLTKGTYIIRLQAGDKVETSKFIKH